MSVNNITQTLQQVFAKLDQTLFLKGGSAFGDSLNIGQIIKGKVLRHYEGANYLVNFEGHEVVVDSAVPLKTGELIYGRVLGLGDQVKLQRLAQEPAEQDKASLDPSQLAKNFSMLSKNERMLSELFAQYQESLSDVDRTLIVSQMNSSTNASLMALSSLILSKLGLLQAPAFLQGVFRNLQGQQYIDNENSRLAPKLSKVESETQADGQKSIQQLGDMLFANFHGMFDKEISGRQKKERDVAINDKFAQNPSSKQPYPQNDDGQSKNGTAYQDWLVGRWILNMQNEGSVAHRYSTFPIWFGDRLVEVNVAIFGQRNNNSNQQLQHKKLVFSINTEYLGKVELTVLAADRHLSVDVVADNEPTAVYMAGYLAELKQSLQQVGWTVDAINYGAAQSLDDDAVVNAVVEHHVTQNSVNHLI